MTDLNDFEFLDHGHFHTDEAFTTSLRCERSMIEERLSIIHNVQDRTKWFERLADIRETLSYLSNSPIPA